MSKKQQNRKIVQQNRRNRIKNKRYTSTIKTLIKLYKGVNAKEEISKEQLGDSDLVKERNFAYKLYTGKNNLFSIIDKAVKKNVLHKNTSARKKAKIHKYSVAKRADYYLAKKAL